MLISNTNGQPEIVNGQFAIADEQFEIADNHFQISKSHNFKYVKDNQFQIED